MPSNKEPLLIAGLIVLYILSVIINLGYFELAGEEPRRAIISLEMLKSGNYFKPTQMGWDYYNKPVLFNWILCGFMSLTNSSSEFILRIPSLVFFSCVGLLSLQHNQKVFAQKHCLAFQFFSDSFKRLIKSLWGGLNLL